MENRFVLLPKAQEDLENIFSYIAIELVNPEAASNLIDTFQTRIISWKAGLKDFKAHPIIGVGHGNYAIIFDKYFTPDFYLQTRGETYFDRAHNNVVDIASTTGVFGISTYLFILLASAYYLIDGYRKKYIGLHDFVLVSCLIIAYFVQNLAVFDSFITYMLIMVVYDYVSIQHKPLENVKRNYRRTESLCCWSSAGDFGNI